jgi:hypothetical protein
MAPLMTTVRRESRRNVVQAQRSLLSTLRRISFISLLSAALAKSKRAGRVI